ncbi:hypothetical protein [Sorangium sp. So ce406]|uniref:hypothetical protein n=1 Tax=Sorangium sp. So ce406 TaxID=3133311 RepID=UPI003F5C1E58
MPATGARRPLRRVVAWCTVLYAVMLDTFDQQWSPARHALDDEGGDGLAHLVREVG